MRVGVKGIVCFGMGLTLRDGSREHFYAALDRHFPGLKQRYIREYGDSYEVPSPNTDRLTALFNRICSNNGILHTPNEVFDYIKAFPDKYEQMCMPL